MHLSRITCARHEKTTLCTVTCHHTKGHVIIWGRLRTQLFKEAKAWVTFQQRR